MPNELQEALDAFEPIAPADTSGELAGNDMAEGLRKSGARRLPGEGPEAYQTNEGTVVLGSPQDQARARLMRTSKPIRRRFDAYGNPYQPMHLPRSLTHDPELDIDWGIHKTTESVTDTVTGMVGGEMAQYYGRCRGGPYNSRRLVHGEGVYRVGFETQNPLRAIPGMQENGRAGLSFGNYVFDDALSEWKWDETSIRHGGETA